MSDPHEARAAGMAKMQEVYGFTVDPADLPGRYTDITVDHLFGTVWTDETLDLRQRRLLTIGVLAAQDKPELLEIQFDSALERGELTAEQVREVVVHLTHYVGWPISTGISGAAETITPPPRHGRRRRRDVRGTEPVSRVETEDAAPGVRVIAFNRPDVRNAFDTAMYQEVTAALRAADADEAVGAVVLTGRGSAFTSGQDLAEMAAIATGTAVEGAGQGFMGLLDCLVRHLGPAARRGQRGRRRAGLHPPGPLRPRPGRRRGAPAGALRRAGRAGRGGEQLPVPRRHGVAAGGADPPDVGLGAGAEELVELGLALQVCAAGTVLDETVALARAHRRPPPRRHPRHHVAHAGGAARRRGGGQPARAGAPSRRCSAPPSAAGTLAEFAARAHRRS